MSDIDTGVVDGLKALDPEWPIREADMNEPCRHVASVPTSVACDGDGVPVFERLRGRRDDRHVILFAFDLLELNGKDLRREPIEVRKAELARLLSTTLRGLQ